MTPLVPSPGIFLSNVQVSLQRLLTLLEVKGGTGNFDLSSAIVPMVDVTGLLGLGTIPDLNPVERVFSGLNLAPHASTVRWTYTVPEGRRAELRNGLIFIARGTAAAPVGTAQANITIIRASTALTQLALRGNIHDNTVGARDIVQLQAHWALRPGDTVQGDTVDLSTGGQVTYHIAASILETG